MKPFEINKVLVPTDFTELSGNAVKTAVAICQRHNASMVLVHAIEAPVTYSPPDAAFSMGTLLTELENSSNENMKRLAEKITAENKIIVERISRIGNPSGTICEVAAETNADLVVMGTHGASGMREFFIGSNAYSVVKNSPVPVMTIPSEGEWKEFKKILFPVRITTDANDKYEVIRQIIQKNKSNLVVLGIAKQGKPESFSELISIVNKFELQLKEDEVIYESEIYQGENLSEKVFDACRVYSPDLIVITTALDHTIKEFFVGPYVQQIVNHSKIPVLSIKPEVSPASNEEYAHQMEEIGQSIFMKPAM